MKILTVAVQEYYPDIFTLGVLNNDRRFVLPWLAKNTNCRIFNKRLGNKGCSNLRVKTARFLGSITKEIYFCIVIF